MRIILLGAAGFIGTNLVLNLVNDPNNVISVVDREKSFFAELENYHFSNLRILQSSLSVDEDYDSLLQNQDVVYHLVSTTIPGTSNKAISEELICNLGFSTILFDACVRQKVKKIVFLSSGGTVYGKDVKCPIDESAVTNPITTYGIQKVTIEKLLYLYHYLYGVDYRVIRLANPFGPYQRPNSGLGVVTTFIYKAIKHEEITVYGDGSVVRDFIYIDDAIRGILNVVNGDSQYRVFNLGCGYGTSINQLIESIEQSLNVKMQIQYSLSRNVDVHENYLDISRYEKEFGRLNPISLNAGILNTAQFLKKHYFL